MSQKDKRYIVISKENYDSLRDLGTITDSFDTVITQILRVAKKETELK
jgi:hypothetical protein